MTMRTVQFIGYGFGAEPATITATMNGVVVHDGAIPTQDTTFTYTTELTPPQQVAFTCEIPLAAGTFSMVITMTNGSAVFGPVTSNYNTWLPEFNQYATDGFADIFQTGPDCRSDVTVDGQPRPTETDPTKGDFWFYIEENQVFAFTLHADAGMVPV